VAIPDAQPSALVEDWKEQRGTRREVARVHVPAVNIGRDRRARAVDRRHADLATERDDRHVDPGQEFRAVAHAGQTRDAQRGIREVVGQEAEARDARRPAPVRRHEVDQLDLEGIAWFGALDGDRPVDLVDAIEIEPGEVLQRRGRGQLPAARVEAVEGDRAARRHRRERGDRRVPGEVELVAGDMERRCCRRHRGPPRRASVAGPGSKSISGDIIVLPCAT
jgi:hypothetical protein